MTILAGVDGCSAGWVVVTQDTGSGQLAWQVVESIAEYLAGNPTPAVMAIDVPIGLPESGPRACDQATRARLGPRRSSVFPAPIRAVLAARSQQEASMIGRGVDGRGISCQCWNIMPKIREIDDLLRQHPHLQNHVREVHPELSFCLLNGRPLSHSKRTRAGSEERLALVETVYAQETIRSAISDCRTRGAKSDDVLDALAALWSAGRASRGEAEALPPLAANDRRGCFMQVLA